MLRDIISTVAYYVHGYRTSIVIYSLLYITPIMLVMYAVLGAKRWLKATKTTTK